jgi:hypothetical protein
VTPPSAFNGFTLPTGGSQICGFMNLNPAYNAVTFTNVTRAKNFGNASDVYTGYDISVNARLPRSGVASGGVSTGHEVLDICDIAGQVNVAYAAVAGVLPSSAGTVQPFGSITAAGATASPSTLYCHVQPPFQPDVKGLVSYPLPWWGLTTSATLQNRPGPQILANYTISAANVGTQTTLGRAVTGGTQTVPLIGPGMLYGDRFTQVDVRFGKAFRFNTKRVQASIDLYNLFNSNGILSVNNTYGTRWQSPTNILQGRLIKFGAKVDF